MYFTSKKNILNIKMAAQETFLDSIDLDVSFNEFDDELIQSDEPKYKKNMEVKSAYCENEDIRTREELDEVDSSREIVGESCLQTENVLTTEEDGEIISEGEENDGEQMVCDDGNDFCVKTLKDGKTIGSDFSNENCQTSAVNINETLEERVFNTSENASNDSDMETEHSQDECSLKRKRPRLETGSSQQETKDHKTQEAVEGKTSSKTRGGRKKRKRPSNRQRESRDFQEGPVDEELSVRTLFEPLCVTAQDIEGKVAKEIAEKLNESKKVLINRVVTCIGTEKALKLFKETQEVQRHGGMWTQDKKRRRTSGGVFLALLKHRYTTKEQIKWIYALENEIAKKKAQAVRQEMKERNKKKVEDLRQKLQELDKNITMTDTETPAN